MIDPLSSLVSTEWLAARLGEPDLVVLDASRHLPAAGRDPRAEFMAGHIPGARFLDLANLTDTASPVPAALPTFQQVFFRMADEGAGRLDRIVLYDDSALRTSARAWFILTAFGFPAVAILDGGLQKWRAEQRPLRRFEPVPTAGVTVPREWDVAPTRVRYKADMLANLASKAEQVLDARGADRVFGTGIDPVHGGQNGRIPGSLNLPFGEVFNADGTFKSPEDLRAAFAAAGVDLARPVVTTCGSGLTASVLLFALHLIGKHDTALYDGSWQEWEADPAAPKEQGPA
jgi:thiosulfate/3-mercaptopyruvate sulfurtransferase